jgi:hypothetical protein
MGLAPNCRRLKENAVATNVVALFDDRATAEAAAQDLIDAGFLTDDISVVARDDPSDHCAGAVSAPTGSDVSGTAIGAGTGAVLGGFLAGIGALALPGIGPVIALGPIAAALAGAGFGAAAGSLLGLLVDLGVPGDEAHGYAEGVRRGGVLVAVRVDDDARDRALMILRRYRPVDIAQRAARWREAGWAGFDETAAPYTSDDVRRERERYRREAA